MPSTSAWKRRPLRSISTMSPGPMPFEVTRGAGATRGAAPASGAAPPRSGSWETSVTAAAYARGRTGPRPDRRAPKLNISARWGYDLGMSAQAPPAQAGTTAAPVPAAAGPEGRRRRRRTVAAWGPWTAIGAVVLGLVAGFAAEAGVVAVVDDGDITTAISLVLVDLVMLAIVLAFAAKGAPKPGPSTLGLRRTAFWPAVGWGLAVLVGAWAVDGLLAIAFGGGDGGGSSSSEHVGAGVAVLLVLGIAVTAPIVEESAFRGSLSPALAAWKGPWLGALITAVLFGAAHVLALPAAFLAGAAAFGFGACLLFWFTGSLLPGIAIHSFNNAIVLALMTGGRLWWAIPLAPLVALLVVAPLSRRRAPQAPEAAAT